MESKTDPLDQDELDESTTFLPQTIRRHARHTTIVWLILSTITCVSLLLNVAFILRGNTAAPKWHIPPDTFYSPARHLATYHPRLFTTGLGSQKSIYQSAPSPAKHDAWRSLYVHSVLLTANEAARLPNGTLPISSSETRKDEPLYLAGLNVFHHLHCLHLLSQATDFLFYPAYHNLTPAHNPFEGRPNHSLMDFNAELEEPFLDSMHVGHCLDSLRQALMCNADLSTHVWQLVSEEDGGGVATFVNTQHMCVDFGAIRAWAGERRWENGIDVVDITEKAMGMCRNGEAGCGAEEYGDRDWIGVNHWLDLGSWGGDREGEGNGSTKIWFKDG